MTDALIAAAILACVAAAAGFLTGALRRYALRAQMIDVPGARSSHVEPTPRGGGLSICLCVLLAAVVLAALGVLDVRLAAAVLAGGGIVTATGWFEDRRGLPAHWRGLLYLAAAGIAVAVLGGAGSGSGMEPFWSVAVNAAAVLGVAWMTNLYNFMDGTDGFAGAECLSVGAWAAVLLLAAGDAGPAWLSAVAAAAAAGFLLWNWSPARIFMGDAGSCFTGFLFGVLAVATAGGGSLSLPAWLILLAFFIGDATLTLLRRALSGEKWYRPHRTHAYQLLVRNVMSHAQLARALLLLNCLVLGPLAAWTVARPDLAPAILVAVAIGVLLAWCFVQWRWLTSARDGSR